MTDCVSTINAAFKILELQSDPVHGRRARAMYPHLMSLKLFALSPESEELNALRERFKNNRLITRALETTNPGEP